MAFAAGIEQPTREHGVAVDAVHGDAVVRQHAHIVLGVLPDFFYRRISEERCEQCFRHVPRHQIMVEAADRQVHRCALVGNATRHADANQVGGQRIKAGGFGVEGKPPDGANVGNIAGQIRE